MVDDRSIVRKNLAKVAGWIDARLHPVGLHIKTWGSDFPDRKFLVIRRRDYGVGLFSYFLTNLGWINYSINNGYVPVIDMKANRTIYHSNAFFRKNVWEDFFCQPFDYGIHDIRHAKNVTIVEGRTLDGIKDFLPDFGADENVESNQSLQPWRKLVADYMRPKIEPLGSYVSPRLEAALSGNGAIGVLARGTDYVRLRPDKHPVQPSFADFVVAIKEYDSLVGLRKPIFLVTEDRNLAMDFMGHYKERLILAKQDFIPYKRGFLCSNKSVVGNKERGFAYLRAIFDLSRCQALIAGRTSGTIGAVLLSKGFVYSKVFNLGKY